MIDIKGAFTLRDTESSDDSIAFFHEGLVFGEVAVSNRHLFAAAYPNL